MKVYKCIIVYIILYYLKFFNGSLFLLRNQKIIVTFDLAI